MPYEWTTHLDESDAPQDDFGDEAELEIIIAFGQYEAENFGGRGMHGRPAKWLNPPRKEER